MGFQIQICSVFKFLLVDFANLVDFAKVLCSFAN